MQKILNDDSGIFVCFVYFMVKKLGWKFGSHQDHQMITNTMLFYKASCRVNNLFFDTEMKDIGKFSGKSKSSL